MHDKIGEITLTLLMKKSTELKISFQFFGPGPLYKRCKLSVEFFDFDMLETQLFRK